MLTTRRRIFGRVSDILKDALPVFVIPLSLTFVLPHLGHDHRSNDGHCRASNERASDPDEAIVLDEPPEEREQSRRLARMARILVKAKRYAALTAIDGRDLIDVNVFFRAASRAFCDNDHGGLRCVTA
jgi:hypothetical protein